MDERHHHGMLCVVLPCNPSLGQESYGAFRRSYPPVFSDARPVEGVIGAEALLAYQPSQFLSQNALVAGLSAFALKLRQTGLLNDNDGSALAEVPYAGGDTAGFAGGEDPPVRGVYKGRSPLCHYIDLQQQRIALCRKGLNTLLQQKVSGKTKRWGIEWKQMS